MGSVGVCVCVCVCIHIYITDNMSLWQKVLPLNPGMFVHYLFSSYNSYTKLWLLLFSMHWWVVKVKIGSFGHKRRIKNKNTWRKSMKSGFRKVGQRGLFDFSLKQQLTSWTILHNLYTIWLLNKLNLVSSWIASHAWRFITKKGHWKYTGRS